MAKPVLRSPAWATFVLLATSCVSNARGPNYPEIADRIPPVPEGKGRLYFYRDWWVLGSGVQAPIRLKSGPAFNGDVVAASERGGVSFSDCLPGSYLLVAKTETRIETKIDVLAGQTTFVRTYVGFGFVMGRVQFEIVSAEEALEVVKNCRYTGPESALLPVRE